MITVGGDEGANVSRRIRSSRSGFDFAGHRGPVLEPPRGVFSRCDSRSRIRAASVSPADAEAPTALIAYAAAPRSWAATCASAAACPAARAANFTGSANPRAAAFAAKAARRASPMRTSPLTTRDRHRWRRGRVSRTPIRLPRTVQGTYLQKGRLRAVDSRVRLPRSEADGVVVLPRRSVRI